MCSLNYWFWFHPRFGKTPVEKFLKVASSLFPAAQNFQLRGGPQTVVTFPALLPLVPPSAASPFPAEPQRGTPQPGGRAGTDHAPPAGARAQARHWHQRDDGEHQVGGEAAQEGPEQEQGIPPPWRPCAAQRTGVVGLDATPDSIMGDIPPRLRCEVIVQSLMDYTLLELLKHITRNPIVLSNFNPGVTFFVL